MTDVKHRSASVDEAIDEDVAIPEVARPIGVRLYLVIISLFLTLFLSAINVTVVATALPTIASHLNATTSEYTWVGSAYTLASTTSTPLWARLSDICGRKGVLMVTNVTFLIGSLICALSVSPAMLIGGRVAQGLGSGGISVVVTIVIGDLFSLRERAKYYALTGIVWAISSGVGPMLGGVFTQTIGWRWCFYINLPFDGVSLVFLFLALNLPTKRQSWQNPFFSFDWAGSILIVGGTICFLYGLEIGASKQHTWDSAYTLGLLIGGIVILAIFGLYEAFHANNPIFPIRVLRDRSILACLSTAFFHSFIFIAYDYFNPLYFQTVLGVSPIESGLYTLALVLPLSAMTLISGLIVKRTGAYRPIIWIAGSMTVLGTGLFIDFGPYRAVSKIVAYQIIAGFGAGPLFQAPMIAFQSHLVGKEDLLAAAIAAFIFLRNLSMAVSLVVGGVILQHGLSDDAASYLKDRASLNPNDNDKGIIDGIVGGFRVMWIFYTAIGGLMLISSLAIGKKDLDSDSDFQGKDSIYLLFFHITPTQNLAASGNCVLPSTHESCDSKLPFPSSNALTLYSSLI
ncbi:efflux pump antibiotic resistance protein, putative [Talaromyces stipitatus ATCC 10500]|uniref:Efflux pump antibiotic resistance protein, putative n=1 Tax=Talaromyces stipitatus (strain ATCC 10500 / CBS 375.48 / QM 6759 / NRRL 1006) TaxID=441959 RepID=B8MMC3_TALSN|nr:efflux pump antibiotic resistance protein, putative [Talaromyces stipitatus ATCC 10500]EED13677.1 efflux pump antibiotic resistance protein, putative [Talaromyces stipitatus ATCC 10500]